MWISKAVEARLSDERYRFHEMAKSYVQAEGRAQRLEIENARLRADMDWFKLRLNAVERERGQLIQAAIGVKVSIPEFVPARDNPEEALNQMPDLSSVGGDARESDDPLVEDTGLNYNFLPQRK